MFCTTSICTAHDTEEASDAVSLALHACAGAVDVLQKLVEERWLDDLAAQDTAAGLLVALRVQQDHVE